VLSQTLFGQIVSGRKIEDFSGKTGGDLNSLLNSGKLPEMHLPGHNFTGPGTKLKERCSCERAGQGCSVS